MDQCLAVTAEKKYLRNPLDTEAGQMRIDPPHLLEIEFQVIRTHIHWRGDPGDTKGVIRSEKILQLGCKFKHPCGETVMVNVDLHRLKANRNHDHYREQVRRFFTKERPLSTREKI